MPPSNPFDFSDFGGRPPGPPPGPPPGVAPPLGAPAPLGAPPPAMPPAGGFDPFAGQPPAPAAAEAFGGPARSATMGSLAVAGPPLQLVAAALAVALVGIIFGVAATVTGSTVVLAFAGWLLAGPAAIGVLAWFNAADTRRRLSSVYSAPTWLSTAYWVVLAACAVGIGIGAWQIALWAGRQ
ncbi:hypothetical protein [Mycobacterium talmoniae]|uniref:Uncharacterized protein n=1 Tax=Mycobacterium talmoniae TaxID=1858794 RepID=A0A1S1MNS8_9MYCO|nr:MULTISPECIES: hypothetical protein [Mycobacterium]OHU86024.1 hypothetical protein BKN37_26310 [Mycobacterium talmoniae]TDH55069.1 hypothetical protein E2F47_10885 [Mycobacterium eburneum]